MAIDITRQGTKGGDPQYDTSQLRGVREERGIVTGIVKANVHGAHMGVIKIFVPTFSTNPEDKSQWRTVRYCTPFYSRVDNQGSENTYGDTKVTSGIVTPPPDLGTKVLAFFPEGRNAEGYYFACIPDTFMLQSVPESSASRLGKAGGEFNDIPIDSKQITNWKKQPRPIDYFTQDQLERAGLDRDIVRGLSTSSYMRESPSELIGISSKGRRITREGQDFTVVNNAEIKNPNTADKTVISGLLGPGYRRKGHSLTLDDGDVNGNSNQVRLRTSTGHQILMNDTRGVIYIGNGDGTAWVELSNTGTMDVYSSDSINFRSKNINFHADEQIKFHSKGYTQLVSDNVMHVQAGKDLVMTAAGEAGITGNDGLHLNSGSSLYASAGGSAYINSSGIMSVAGALVLLQGPKTKAKTAKSVRETQKEDTTYMPDQQRYILDEEQPVTTTVDRVTTHEPYPYHCVPNTSTAYSGGLVGGGGGFLSTAFAIVGGISAISEASAALESVDGGLASAVVNQGGAAGSVVNAAQGSGIDFSQITGEVSRFTDTVAGAQDSFVSDLGEAFTEVAGQVSEFAESSGLADKWESVKSQFSDLTFTTGTGTRLEDLDAAVADGGSAFFGDGNVGKFVADAQGKITTIGSKIASSDIATEFQARGGIERIKKDFTTGLPQILNNPVVKTFAPIEFKQTLNTGYQIGKMDSFDVQALNTAVVKTVGSNNATDFIDSTTKSLGKYGVNVNQLIKQGYVRPEAKFNDQLQDPSMWTGKNGVTSRTKFLEDGNIQEAVQQAVIADDYQNMVTSGAIKNEYTKEEVMAMLTASNITSPEVASQISQGFDTVEGIAKNTTNVKDLEGLASSVKDAMQTGSAASRFVDRLKNNNKPKTPNAGGATAGDVAALKARLAQQEQQGVPLSVRNQTKRSIIASLAREDRS